MYIETSSPRRPGDKAMLASPKYSSATGKCLQFWYHMYGSHIGTLNVYIKRILLGRVTYSLSWSRSGNHGNQWWIGQVQRNVFNNRYKPQPQQANLSQKCFLFLLLSLFKNWKVFNSVFFNSQRHLK